MKEFSPSQEMLIQRYKKISTEEQLKHINLIKIHMNDGWGYFSAVRKAGFPHEYGVYLRKMHHDFDEFVLETFYENNKKRHQWA